MATPFNNEHGIKSIVHKHKQIITKSKKTQKKNEMKQQSTQIWTACKTDLCLVQG